MRCVSGLRLPALDQLHRQTDQATKHATPQYQPTQMAADHFFDDFLDLLGRQFGETAIDNLLNLGN